MTDKTKRNPRRRLLVMSLLIIGLIIALISAGMYLLRPGGAQIVFVAPDDAGADQLWLVNLNDLEHVRQLTNVDSPVLFTGLRVASDNQRVLLHLVEGRNHSLWTMNPETGATQHISDCENNSSCTRTSLSFDGRWLALEDHETITESLNEITLRIIDLDSGTSETIFSLQSDDPDIGDVLIGWIEDSGYLVYRSNPENAPATVTIYDVSSDQIIDTVEIIDMAGRFTTRFSPDGQYYSYRIFQQNFRIQFYEIYAINEPDTALFSTLPVQESTTQDRHALQDWHPDSEHILVANGRSDNGVIILNEMRINNILDNSSELIFSNDERYTYPTASFNYDGSQILYYRHNVESDQGEILIYDIESGEHILLPFAGAFPQWVNGGR